MPREHVDNGRVELRLKPEDKAVLARAAAIERLDLTSFILHAALPRAQAVITESEKLRLSERDSLRVLPYLRLGVENTQIAAGGFDVFAALRNRRDDDRGVVFTHGVQSLRPGVSRDAKGLSARSPLRR